MKKFYVLFIFLAAATFSTAGCNILPEPGSLIQAPKQANAKASDSKNMIGVAKKYLPKGTVLTAPNSPVHSEAVLMADFDEDGHDEAVVFYQSKNSSGPVGIFVLKKAGDLWEKVFAKTGVGYEISWASASDITGDGKNELLVGWKIGNTAGSTLEIFTWRKDGMDLVTKVNYHELDLIHIGNDPKARLAIWKKDGNDIYDIDLLEWKGKTLQSDKNHYPSYFPEVVNYYKRRTAAVPDASYYWYYQADALLKANLPEQALAAVDEGMSFNMVVPSYNQFVELREKIERAITLEGNRNLSLELRDAGITMEIPREIASYITVEESPSDMTGYEASVFVSAGDEKKKLFTIEIYSKDMYMPEDDSELERIAESEQFVYFARKADAVPAGGAIYEKSYALVDKMIANVRPGNAYPAVSNLENELILKQVKDAADKYAYVTSGGKMPEGIIETFTKNEMEYRYLGSDLDTKEKLFEFLSDSYTPAAIRSYILRANLIEKDGKLAQPNADGSSLLNYEKAVIVRKKDNGTEKEFDLKVPLGNSLSYEYVHVVFSKTRDGWRISSDLGTF
ncbi:hypothetical protein D4T97_011670 [Siminovitchia acidinfaciens]|uniref:Uncharacterized protein n=1 Tax=Siminovitchia acidinfaciens TaxID=2321395 RepID=A0A429XZV3_9BACI|nr:DL-endopeptidase inhibitor IseA family protein [Siminovitchia acidinfaciens]RST74322.1 hypothetical protein D4T97_011670 [Siminovitchia acidinfaciens]